MMAGIAGGQGHAVSAAMRPCALHSGIRSLGARSASRGDTATGGGAGSKEEGEKGSPTGIVASAARRRAKSASLLKGESSRIRKASSAYSASIPALRR